MTEKLIMQDMNIPDGMLHDSKLYNVSLENNELILSFETCYCPENYAISEFVKKYKDYKVCHVKCKFADENSFFCNAYLETSVDKKSKYKACVLSIQEFVDFAKKEIKERNKKGGALWDYIHTFVSPNIRTAKIELGTYSSKYKGTIYQSCTLELETEEIEFVWEQTK